MEELLQNKIKKYIVLLGKTGVQLTQLKNEKDPMLRVVKGMETLPELKERALLCKQFLEDLKEIEECLKNEKS